MPVTTSLPHRDGLTALALFGFLLAVYLLTFNGRFTAIDELALYARSESLVQRGDLATPQLAFAAYHNPVGPSEPGFSVLAAPLYWLAQQNHRLNNIHTVMLLNPLLTAATAVLLYAGARLFGYSQPAAVLAALCFGLTTLAWPYARSFYREPLVGFGWSLGLYGLLAWRYQGSRFWAVIGLASLCLTLLVKTSAVVGVPVILLAALARLERRQLVRYGIVLAGIVVAVGVLFQIVFSLRYGAGASLADWTSWSWQINLRRIYGQLLSPGKGILFYAPTVLLAAPGLALMWRQHRAASLAAGLPLLALIAAYSGYDAWYGGQSWGPRFLLPGLPLLLVAIAPFWDYLRQPLWRWLSLALILLSLILQLAVSTADWGLGSGPLYQSGPNPEDTTGMAFANLHLSPPLVQLQRWRPQVLDLLWLRPDLDGRLVFSARLAAGLALATAAAAAAWWLVSRRKAAAAWLPAPPLLAIAVLLAWGPAATPGYPGLTAEEGRRLAQWAGRAEAAPYTLVTMSNEFHIYYYLGFLKGQFTHHWLSPTQTEDFEVILQQASGDRFVLVMDRVHIPPDHSGKDLEWWLNEQLYRAGSAWVGNFELVDYADFSPAEPAWQTAAYQFGDSFILDRFSLNQDRLRRGQTLGVQLHICRSGPLPDYHHLFLHLISPTGAIHGYDGPIRYGGTLLLPWEEGDCLVERRALPIAADSIPGVYDLVVGFDTSAGPLPVTNPTGEPAAYTVLRRVEILPE